MTWPVLLLLSLPAQPMQVSELARVEKLLKEAGLATDGPGLVAYLKAQTTSPEDATLLTRLVRELGDDSFDTREEATRRLIEAGRKAASYLKPALTSKDLEVAQRAARCLEAIVESPLAAMMPSVVRLLAERLPADGVPVLIAYLRGAGDEPVEDAIFDALRVLGVRAGSLDPALVAALADRAPVCRAAAAHVAGDAANSDEAKRLVPLLRDTEPRVRFEAAQALLRRGDPVGGPVLITLLEEAPREIAWQAEAILGQVAGTTTIPAIGGAAEANRTASAAAWRDWWTRSGPKAGWQPPRPLEPFLGRTLVAEYDSNPGGGAIYELGRDGKKRWQLDGLQGPNCVQALPGGRLLVAERNADQVGEYDRSGKLHWSHRTTGSPIAAQRLANGSTLIVTFGELLIVTPEGKKTVSFPCVENLRGAYARPDGSLVAITAKGDVVEVSSAGKEVRRVTPSSHASGAGYWAAVTSLPEGRYLAAFSGAGKVVDMDTTGKFVKEFTVASPVSLERLRNGNTLIASFEGRQVIEIDADGKEVWKSPTRGRPFYAVRY